MVDLDAPLDFESEDALVTIPQNTRKRRKVIVLDDLLTDYYEERNKLVEKESKWASVKKCYNSDDDDKTRKKKEALLTKFVDDCQKQVHEIVTEDDIPSWGRQIFGQQKALPSLDIPALERCKLLQSFFNSEFNFSLELDAENGRNFFEGLLINGWLSKLVLASGHVEDPLALWTFNLMLYSPNDELQAAACEFWLAVLPSNDEVNIPSVRLDWFPGYNQLKDALKTYGYLSDSFIDVSSLSDVDHSNFGQEGPLPNIRSWVKVLGACCQMRTIHSMFSTSEVEEFLDDEWLASSKKVANALAYRIPKDSNCLRMVECISGVSIRSKHLRNEVAFQILLNCFEMKATDSEEVLRSVLSINLKDNRCNFFKIYIYLVLVENWLFSTEQTPVILGMWGAFLRSCSCQITSTDWRSYASKVRNKASYLLQNTSQNFD
ncbi:hypothetical protein AAC387_Pa03g1333 [Persea americana]